MPARLAAAALLATLATLAALAACAHPPTLQQAAASRARELEAAIARA